MHANLSGPRACVSVYCLRLLGRLAFAWALPQCVAHGSQAYDGLQVCIISVECTSRLLGKTPGQDSWTALWVRIESVAHCAQLLGHSSDLCPLVGAVGWGY